MAEKRCEYCGRWFHPHTPQQKLCPQQECRRARQRQKLKSWRKRHPGFAEKYRPKVRAWAEGYPDYWRQWRADHVEYRAREKQRMRAKRRKARRVANDTGVAGIAVEKLRTVRDLWSNPVANETGLSRRVDAVVEFLIWKETVAKRNRIGMGIPGAG